MAGGRGVYTVADLLDRCRVDEVTGCWHLGAVPRSTHTIRCPQLGRNVGLGVLVCVLRTGKAPAPGVVWHTTCGTRNCANPAHRRAGNRQSQMLAAQVRPSVETVARIARTKRARSALSDEQVAEIRRSTDRCADLAERYGISLTYVSHIRRGRSRRELAVPASVFSWGGRA